MRPLSTFTALLLSSTILMTSPAYAEPASLLEAINDTDFEGPYTMPSNQDLTGNTVLLKRELTVTGEKYGIKGNITVSDGYVSASSDSSSDVTVPGIALTRGNLKISGVGGAAINETNNDYTVTDITNKWWNGATLTGLDDGGNPVGVSDASHALAVDADAEVTSNVFADSHTKLQGAAIYLTGLGKTQDESEDIQKPSRENINVTVDNNLFYKNVSLAGSAIDLNTEYAKANSISGNYFIQNIATGSDVREQGHGGAIDNSGTVAQFANNVFYGNVGLYSAGALYMHNGSSMIGENKGNQFIKNIAAEGAAIYVEPDAKLVLTDAKFLGNTTSDVANGNSDTMYGLGGAIYNRGGTITLQGNNTFSGNQAGLAGHDIYNAGEKRDADGNLEYAAGTIEIVGARDDIDGSGHVTFNTAGGIENLGTFKFTNSHIQLHEGMSSDKTGTVEVAADGLGNASYIDLGDHGQLKADNVTVSGGSTIQTHIQDLNAATLKNGAIVANTIELTGNNNLKVAIDNGWVNAGEAKKITVLDVDNPTEDLSNDFANVSFLKDALHEWYEIESNNDGTYTITRDKHSSTDECDGNECETAIGWLDRGDPLGFDDNELAKDIRDKLDMLAADVDCTDDEYRDALDALAPDVSPLIRSHVSEINRRLYSVISNRLYSSMERTGYIYRGKRYYRFPQEKSHLWAQGFYGKSKYDVRKGFDGHDQGLAIGFDGHVNEALRMGVGYSYTQGDYDSIGRKTDIDSHTGMFYGEYNPNRFFVNWLATYTRSQFTENKNVLGMKVDADYDVDAIGAQVMFGQKMGPYIRGNWSTGVFMPEVGLRYLYTKQGSYTDTAGQSVDGMDASSLTGILGMQYTIGYTLSPTVSWYPELRAAVTYDIVESDASTRVNLVNGAVYEVKEETMDRLGFELGGRVGLDINRTLEMSLEYEGVYRGDYINHTGLANLKYKF